jgi:hypothetical protein
MDRVLEMEAKPEFVQSKEFEALGQILPASEVLRQVGFMLFRGGLIMLVAMFSFS